MNNEMNNKQNDIQSIPSVHEPLTKEQILSMISIDCHSTVHTNFSQVNKTISQDELQMILKEVDQQQKQHTSKAIWMNLNFQNLNHLQYLIQKGYVMHRAVQQSVCLYKWCKNDVKDNVPPFSRFFVGCGAVIIKDNKIFQVKEKRGDRKGYFGIPGGRADVGQFISTVTQRQLFEQTGMKGKFEYILYFRQLPKTLWGASDLYFVNVISVDDSEFDKIKLCEEQIQEYRWIQLSQYEKFAHENGFGSQLHLSTHISELYNKGYDFTKKSNQAFSKQYRKGNDRMMIEHLITGLDILDIQQKKNIVQQLTQAKL